MFCGIRPSSFGSAVTLVMWGVAHSRHASTAQCLASHRGHVLQTALVTLHTLTMPHLHNLLLLNVHLCCRQRR